MIEFSARYYDGKSSEPHDVTVRVDAGATLHVEGLPAPLECGILEYGMQEVRISPRLGNTVRSLAFADGGKCETADNDAVDRLQELTGAARAGILIHGLESKWRYALAGVAILVLLVVVGFKWGIPVLAERTARMLPKELAFDLGRGTLSILDSTLLSPSELDTATQERLRGAFAHMAVGHPELPLTLLFRRGIGPNALALPDGTVIVTDELVELSQNDQQVLAVLAHEIGHVHHRHALRTALEGSAIALLIATWIGDVSSLTALSTGLPTVYLHAHYSREHEWEADTFALDYLRAHDIGTHHFADIMRLMVREYGSEEEDFSYLSSHPPTDERIRRFER